MRVFETDDPSSLHLRKPPKVQGRIRVVEIEGFDQSACGGTHLKNSAEIGLLKIVRRERVRANVRLYYAAGYRALRDYQLKHEIVQRLQRLVTLPLAEIPLQVEALLDEKDELRRELKKARRREMEPRSPPPAPKPGPGDPRIQRPRPRRPALFRQRPHGSRQACPGLPALAAGRMSSSAAAAATSTCARVSARIFALLDGKGGGSANLLEGRGDDLSRIGEVVDLLRREPAGSPPGPRRLKIPPDLL